MVRIVRPYTESNIFAGRSADEDRRSSTGRGVVRLAPTSRDVPGQSFAVKSQLFDGFDKSLSDPHGAGAMAFGTNGIQASGQAHWNPNRHTTDPFMLHRGPMQPKFFGPHHSQQGYSSNGGHNPSLDAQYHSSTWKPATNSTMTHTTAGDHYQAFPEVHDWPGDLQRYGGAYHTDVPLPPIGRSGQQIRLWPEDVNRNQHVFWHNGASNPQDGPPPPTPRGSIWHGGSQHSGIFRQVQDSDLAPPMPRARKGQGGTPDSVFDAFGKEDISRHSTKAQKQQEYARQLQAQIKEKEQRKAEERLRKVAEDHEGQSAPEAHRGNTSTLPPVHVSNAPGPFHFSGQHMPAIGDYVQTVGESTGNPRMNRVNHEASHRVGGVPFAQGETLSYQTRSPIRHFQIGQQYPTKTAPSPARGQGFPPLGPLQADDENWPHSANLPYQTPFPGGEQMWKTLPAVDSQNIHNRWENDALFNGDFTSVGSGNSGSEHVSTNRQMPPHNERESEQHKGYMDMDGLQKAQSHLGHHQRGGSTDRENVQLSGIVANSSSVLDFPSLGSVAKPSQSGNKLREQIEENRKRKEDEKKKQHEEEMKEMERLEKERKSLQEDYEKEQVKMKAKQVEKEREILRLQIEDKKRREEEERKREEEKERLEEEKLERDRRELENSFQRDQAKSRPPGNQQATIAEAPSNATIGRDVNVRDLWASSPTRGRKPQEDFSFIPASSLEDPSGGRKMSPTKRRHSPHKSRLQAETGHTSNRPSSHSHEQPARMRTQAKFEEEFASTIGPEVQQSMLKIMRETLREEQRLMREALEAQGKIVHDLRTQAAEAIRQHRAALQEIDALRTSTQKREVDASPHRRQTPPLPSYPSVAPVLPPCSSISARASTECPPLAATVAHRTASAPSATRVEPLRRQLDPTDDIEFTFSPRTYEHRYSRRNQNQRASNPVPPLLGVSRILFPEQVLEYLKETGRKEGREIEESEDDEMRSDAIGSGPRKLESDEADKLEGVDPVDTIHGGEAHSSAALDIDVLLKRNASRIRALEGFKSTGDISPSRLKKLLSAFDSTQEQICEEEDLVGETRWMELLQDEGPRSMG